MKQMFSSFYVCRTFFVFSMLLGYCSGVSGEVKLPSVFNSNMVLQRDGNTPVWGWADPSEAIQVEVADQVKKTVADAQGNWLVTLDPTPAGGPFTLTVKGRNNIQFENVLFGDVWICSGQSNMGWTLGSANDAQKEIAEANFPKIRLMTVQAVSKAVPQKDVPVVPWVECSSTTAGKFSAVGYFFGRKLYQELDVPIGLINNSWGGATCEAYIEAKRLDEVQEFKPVLDPKRIEEQKPQYRAGHLYNGMVLPIVPFGIKGAIWYQGESNAARAWQHGLLFPVLIQNWREIWGQGDFPFYFVQLANFRKVQPEPGESDWAELRQSQTAALSRPNTGEAVIIDLGEAEDIHPKNKQDVGSRLAALALAKDYGKDVVWSGPRFKSMKIINNKAILSFDFVCGGLETKPQDTGIKGFALAGTDRKWYWAEAIIEGDQVVVSSAKVPKPVAVRYAWADNPECNLYNKEGFPASPFRTDLWPAITRDNR